MTPGKERTRSNLASWAIFLLFVFVTYVLLSFEIGFWIGNFTNNLALAYLASFVTIGMVILLSFHFFLVQPMLNFEIRILHSLSKRGLIEIESSDDETVSPPSMISENRKSRRSSLHA